MIVAVILAAGESRRMGRPKALLPVEGVPFIERIVTALRKTRVGKILVVLGHDAEEMKERIAYLDLSIVENKDYRLGQLSSLIAAIRSLQREPVDGLLVHLVDHPFIDRALVDTMIDRFYQSKKLIVVPRHGDRRGHPVIFSRSLFPELLAAPIEEGAKVVVRRHREETLEIETDDPGVLVDIDTPEEYQRQVEKN